MPQALKTDELLINMGPQHPSTHGVLRLEIHTDGEIVKRAIPHIGYLHRNFEKHAEHVSYNGVTPYTDRMDYLAAMNMNFGWVLTVEKLMGIEPTPRCEHLRVLIAELNRIASHLVAFGTYGLDMGAFTAFMYSFRERELVLDLFEEICGARLTYNYYRVGGVMADAPDGWFGRVTKFLDYFMPRIKEYNDLLSYNKIFLERSRNVGVITAEEAINWGVTGPNLRACGVKFDLRKDEPYSIYPELDFDVPVGTDEISVIGDSWNRYIVRIQEMYESARICRQILDRMPEGDLEIKVPKRPPKGEIYMRTEAPRGELGFYLISNGKDIPFRLKARSGCFCNIGAIEAFMDSTTMIADLVAILGSLDIVLGEIDR